MATTRAARPCWPGWPTSEAGRKSSTGTCTSIRNCRTRSIAPAARVAERLRAIGFSVHEGIGGTGVVGVLGNGDGPTVLLRADMDGVAGVSHLGR
jgi:hypothetical protein